MSREPLQIWSLPKVNESNSKLRESSCIHSHHHVALWFHLQTVGSEAEEEEGGGVGGQIESRSRGRKHFVAFFTSGASSLATELKLRFIRHCQGNRETWRLMGPLSPILRVSIIVIVHP